MNRRIIPLRQRPVDVAIVAFFLLNLLFITYVVDLEQLVIANPSHFTYPLWPPAPAVDLIHWWGRTFDHDLIARPAWWKVTIWLDNLFFGPFYLLAIYAYVKGKDWIRMPSVVYASILLTNVLVILGEEYAVSTPPQTTRSSYWPTCPGWSSPSSSSPACGAPNTPSPSRRTRISRTPPPCAIQTLARQGVTW